MNSFVKALLVAAAILFASMSAEAGPCDAVFNFDGNLSDSSGNGNDGTMIGEEGKPAKPVFAPGRSGQALKLDGTSAMRAPVDLYIKKCPQVTISAWINVPEQGRTTTQFLLSTGNPQGPGLQLAGSILTLNGPANGLWELDAIRPNSGWRFIAGIYDFAAGTYALHWRDREPEFVAMGSNVREWQDMLWVGAMDDAISHPATGVLIDNVTVTGGALSYDQLVALKNAKPRQLPGDHFNQPQQLPGDHFNQPQQLPGDHFDQPQQLPGDHFNQPQQLPGDHFNQPQQLPGDHFNTEQANSDGSSIAMAVPGTSSIGTGMSIDADAAVADRQNQIPVLSGTSSGGSSASPPSAYASGTSAQAVASIPPRPTGNNRFSAVAGFSGSNQEALTSANNFINVITWWEIADRPCMVSIHDHLDEKLWAKTECASGTFANGAESVSLQGSDRIIGRLEVCNNDNSNQRLKGIRIWGDRVQEDGSIQYEPASSSQARANCKIWSPSVMCPTDTYATGVVIHSADRGDITGLQLVCRAIERN